MYKNQLQEVAQRSCFNLPSYTSIREGPDHAPRFKAIVNFNGDLFESPNHCSTLRQAEHAAAHVALNSLSSHGPSPSLAARILDETGVYKNLLQEIAQRVGAPLPRYTTFRSGSGHQPVFKGIVELSGIVFHGEPAKNKKQAEKNAAMAAWSSLKQLAQQDATSSTESESSDEQEQIRISRCLLNYYLKQKTEATNSSNGAPVPFQKQFPVLHRPSSPQPPLVTTSKILPLICQNTNPQTLPSSSLMANDRPLTQPQFQVPKVNLNRVQKFPAVGAPPYLPYGHYRMPYHVIAPPVIMRTAVPVFSAPPFPQSSVQPMQMMQPRPVRVAQPILIRQAVPAFNASPVKNKDPPRTVATAGCANEAVCQAETASDFGNNQPKPDQVTKSLEQLKI